MKQADYIQSIEIKALWKGGKHIKWELNPTVNILSGINGVGKSTIINHSARSLKLIDNGEMQAGEVAQGITIKLFPEDATSIKFDVIRSFDRPLLNSNLPVEFGLDTSIGQFLKQITVKQKTSMRDRSSIFSKWTTLPRSTARTFCTQYSIGSA